MTKKEFDLEEQFIVFAADIMDFSETFPRSFSNDYLANQIIRSAGSSALNFGEMQGAGTDKDYINKGRIAFKELKETHINLRIMKRRKVGEELNRESLLDENTQLIKILITLIKNRKGGA
ncbi:four helix bundle protein [Bacteroidia bacterium]|nr:four helix bundle protein [Bacteroidia bacterium]